MTLPQITQNSTNDDEEFFSSDSEFNPTTPTHIQREYSLNDDYIGQRIDQIVAQVWSDFSRERLKSWLQDGQLLVDGQQVKPKYRSQGQETLRLDVQLTTQTANEPEAIALDIVYEDDALLVVNKPIGLVVHPGAGNPKGTLLNGLLHHIANANELPRAGLVHRIDKDTSGLLVVAKTLTAYKHLTDQLADKSMYRLYHALCYGQLIAGKTVDAPIKRHPTERTKMAVVEGGRAAVTHLKVLERFGHFTLLEAQLETGRTHQIRVHCGYIGHPLVGDGVYTRLRLPKGASTQLREMLQQYKHQALHAHRLGLIHPVTGEAMQFEAPRPADFERLLNQLREEDA